MYRFVGLSLRVACNRSTLIFAKKGMTASLQLPSKTHTAVNAREFHL